MRTELMAFSLLLRGYALMHAALLHNFHELFGVSCTLVLNCGSLASKHNSYSHPFALQGHAAKSAFR